MLESSAPLLFRGLRKVIRLEGQQIHCEGGYHRGDICRGHPADAADSARLWSRAVQSE